MPDDCIFCQIANREAEAPIEYDSGELVILPSKYPAAETHLLVIPKKHIENIAKVGAEDQELLGSMLLLASKTAAEKGLEDYKLIFNAGKYAKVPHLHLHLLAGDLEDNT